MHRRSVNGEIIVCLENAVGSRRIDVEGLRLSSTSGCSACDCEFVATVSDLEIRFVTADLKLVRAFPDVAVPFRSF